MPEGSGISTPFKDYVCPKPEPKKSDWGGFGTPLSDGQAPTPGIMGETQMAELHDSPKEGSLKPMHLPGSAKRG